MGIEILRDKDFQFAADLTTRRHLCALKLCSRFLL